MLGVFIKKGLQNWQIVQQKDGFAEVELSGYFIASPEADEERILARAVREVNGENVTGWQQAQMENQQKGQWELVLKVPVGGPYRIETCLNENNQAIEWSKRGDMIHHIGIGDVFVIAGQSNSAGYGRDTVEDAPEVGVHLLRNNGNWDLATHPMNDSTGTIHGINREEFNPGHSPYLHFAKILKRELGYPIGLVQAALGGSPLSRWNPGETGDLYDNMLELVKLQCGGIKGILWYQGCQDTNQEEAPTYYERFMNMVSKLRDELKNQSLSILTVQLNRILQKTNDVNTDAWWGRVREAQRQAAKNHDVFVVPAIDCRLSDMVHNSSASNLVIGERLAKTALGGIYGKQVKYKAPNIKTARFNDKNRIDIEFEDVYERIYAYDLPVTGLPFEARDDIGAINFISYHISKPNTITLLADRNIAGTSVVHGAYETNPKAFIPFDTGTHLPMLSFYHINIEREGDA